jgi:hypothetical protein
LELELKIKTKRHLILSEFDDFFQKLQKMIFFSKPFLFNQLESREFKYLKIKKIFWKSFSFDKEKFFFWNVVVNCNNYLKIFVKQSQKCQQSSQLSVQQNILIKTTV